MAASDGEAPGWPGIAPRWTSSAKSGVGTARAAASRVWFTLSHGILDEVYYPRVDQACTRDLGLIVTDGQGFFSEEKRDARSATAYAAPGVPAFRLANTCRQGRYRIEKEVVADPQRDVVLQRVRFVPLAGAAAAYHVYALLAPHLGNCGGGNTAWLGDYKDVPMLFAERDGLALALACSAPWLRRSAGFVGASDGWQDLRKHYRMEWEYRRASRGNVALTGEVDLGAAPDGTFVLALAFGAGAAEAGQRALASLQDGFDAALEEYVAQWQAWQRALLPLDGPRCEAPRPGVPRPRASDCRLPAGRALYRVSTAVLRTHEAKHAPGGIIAGLSIPWGRSEERRVGKSVDLGGRRII